MADSDNSLYNLRYNQVTSNLEAFGGGTPQWTLVTLNNVDPQQVPITRQINTTAPLFGGGNLSADRTLSIPAANNTTDGYLLSTDWSTFNGKLSPSLTSAELFVGNGSNVAAGVPLSGDATITNAGVLSLMNVNSNVGSFTLASITVDAKGRITAASSGSAAGITQLTGDVTAGPGVGSQVATLATVNSNVGSFTNTTLTVNAKGLITAASSGTTGNLTDAGTDGITVTGGTGAVLGSGTSLSQHVADTTHNGYLASTDWNTFNGKQAAGNYITALTGDATATGPGSVALTLATVNASPGATTLSSVTTNAKGLVTANSSATTTGSGSVVLATSPTLVTPTLGAASATSINFGGTSLANYQEGTWTPTDNSGAGLSFTVNYASYVRVGRVVHISMFVSYPSTANGSNSSIAGLPITVAAGGQESRGLAVTSATLVPYAVRFIGGGTTMNLEAMAGRSIPTNTQLSTSQVFITGFYFA